MVEGIVFPATIPHRVEGPIAHVFNLVTGNGHIENRGVLLFEQALKIGAHCIVCLGMASEASGFRIEQVTRNRVCNERYCPEFPPKSRISSAYNYNDTLSISLRRWDLHGFAKVCRREQLAVPVTYSEDPGGFCCNHLMWQLAEAQEGHVNRYDHISWIFMHVPCCHEALPVPPTEFLGLGKTVISKERLIEGTQRFVELTHI